MKGCANQGSEFIGGHEDAAILGQRFPLRLEAPGDFVDLGLQIPILAGQLTVIWLWRKNPYQNGTLVHGNKD